MINLAKFIKYHHKDSRKIARFAIDQMVLNRPEFATEIIRRKGLRTKKDDHST